MTITTGYFHTSEGDEIALGSGYDGEKFETVAVLAEHSEGDLVAGQLKFLHDVPHGSEPGHFSS